MIAVLLVEDDKDIRESIAELLEAFRVRYRGFIEAFRKASIRWRTGDPTAPFPESAIKPFVWPTSEPMNLAA